MGHLDSMYAQYKEEYENVFTVMEPEVGFANYKLEKEHEDSVEIYIQEIFVMKNVRGLKQAAKIADKTIKEAEKKFNKRVSMLYGSVGVGSKTSNMSIRAMTAYGFNLLSANEQLIYFYKEL